MIELGPTFTTYIRSQLWVVRHIVLILKHLLWSASYLLFHAENRERSPTRSRNNQRPAATIYHGTKQGSTSACTLEILNLIAPHKGTVLSRLRTSWLVGLYLHINTSLFLLKYEMMHQMTRI